jgi:hypothetical protein
MCGTTKSSREVGSVLQCKPLYLPDAVQMSDR